MIRLDYVGVLFL